MGNPYVSCSANASVPSISCVQSSHRAIHEPVEHGEPALERPVEGLFFERERPLDASGVRPQFGISGLERRDDGRYQRGQKAVRIAEQFTVSNGAADQKPQHVPAIGVRGIDAVVDEKRDRARVIGDDVLPDALLGGIERRLSRLGLRGDQIGKEIRVVHRSAAVANGKHSLEARARVDRLARKFRERTVGAAIVLLKDDVPDLDEAIA